MNDNERKGLPKDIDLLETAIKLLKVKPNDQRRVKNLLSCMKRVLPQVEGKVENKFSFNFAKSLHQGCANLHVSKHKLSHPDYLPENRAWLVWKIK